MIGLFDSGVGGLSVWRELERILPGAPTCYLADHAHLPYGSKSPEEIRVYAVGITRFLLGRGARLVVVACNSASGAALRHLRARFPDTPFVGTEPAVKPAALQTRTGHVGILATPVTFQGDLYASLAERYGEGVRLTSQVCPGLVEQVERGRLDTPDTVALLEGYLRPLLGAGVDCVVLGCTHYSFLAPAIERIVGPGVRVVDPASAVAAQARRVALERGVGGGVGGAEFWTTGETRGMEDLLRDLGPVTPVRKAAWQGVPSGLVPADVLSAGDGRGMPTP